MLSQVFCLLQRRVFGLITHEFLDKIQFLALLNLGGGVLHHVWRLCILFGGFVYCLGALYIVWELRIMLGSFSLRV